MKKTQSIQNQLLVNILLPSLIVLTLVFYFFYQYNLELLQENTEKNKRNVLAETNNLIAYYDFSIHKHEEQFVERMTELSYLIKEKIINLEVAKKINLIDFALSLEMDTLNEHIYLIDRDTRIFNTTFPTDFGMRFADFGNQYFQLFNKIYQSNKLKIDRFGTESRTQRIKKYSFISSKDSQFLIELGFYSNDADEYRGLLMNKIEKLSKRYEGINSSHLYLAVKGIENHLEKDEKIKNAYKKCLQTKKNTLVENDNPKTRTIEKVEFLFLPVKESNIYAGYILKLEVDDSAESKLFYSMLQRFAIFALVSGVLLLSLILWRTRKLSKPIEELEQQTKKISSTNLDSSVSIDGPKELQSLATSFNQMTKKLKTSYDELEDKVVARTKELSTKNSIIEHKNKEITESIEYAKFIQNALLPSKNVLKNFFTDFSIFYQPKDIVAGDFYWFNESENYCYFAVADCTGHGVPGAMVSVLCVNSLNASLENGKELTTGDLLNRTREQIIERLTKEDSALQDGMDISILRIAKDKSTLQWSGANNPLWIFGQETESIVADKQPVGKYSVTKNFVSHDILLKGNELIVLFTDGFPDQFGGPKNKKFKYTNFQQLIQEQKNEKATEIKENLKIIFNNWKGEEEQTDDVCVAIIRI